LDWNRCQSELQSCGGRNPGARLCRCRPLPDVSNSLPLVTNDRDALDMKKLDIDHDQRGSKLRQATHRSMFCVRDSGKDLTPARALRVWETADRWITRFERARPDSIAAASQVLALNCSKAARFRRQGKTANTPRRPAGARSASTTQFNLHISRELKRFAGVVLVTNRSSRIRRTGSS